ncbi:MAG: TIGR03032 family protein [Flavobacteriales bacterium]
MPSSAPAPPFSLRYTPQVPELLHQLDVTLVLSTYQAGKLVFISAPDGSSLAQLPRNFEKAMGVAERPETDQLAIACRQEVLLFRNSHELASHYPKSPGKYDAMYMPRAAYFTGPLDLHDLHFDADGGLLAVNTLFSCIVKVDEMWNFNPVWQPPFIDRIAGEDRCHLNGLAMENGRPKYVTAFSTDNVARGWRRDIMNTGVVMDVATQEVLARGLSMPHSPTIIDGKLYVLLSGTGDLVGIDRNTGEVETIVSIGGFVRGFSHVGEYAFVGLSRIREKSKTFGHLSHTLTNNVAGVMIIHLPTKSKVGLLEYQSSVEEIYDVHILRGKRRPNILSPVDEKHRDGLAIPTTTFWRQRLSVDPS